MHSVWNRVTTGVLALIAVALVGVIATLAADAYGGPLDPQAPPGSTKPLIEPRTPISQPASAAGFPIVINQPGSYYLATNITGVTLQNGISITASGVTLDLNGFQLAGVPGSNYGIEVPGAVTNLTVRNGVVKSWGPSGIHASLASSGTFEDLQLTDNAGSGLQAAHSSRIARIVARGNTATGITTGAGAGGGFVVDSVASGNSVGVRIEGNNFTLTRSVIVNNTSVGVALFGATAWVIDNDISGNTAIAVQVDGTGATITGNLIITASAGFDIVGTNNHIGSNATIAAGTVASTDVWSNIRYAP